MSAELLFFKQELTFLENAWALVAILCINYPYVSLSLQNLQRTFNTLYKPFCSSFICQVFNPYYLFSWANSLLRLELNLKGVHFIKHNVFDSFRTCDPWKSAERSKLAAAAQAKAAKQWSCLWEKGFLSGPHRLLAASKTHGELKLPGNEIKQDL